MGWGNPEDFDYIKNTKLRTYLEIPEKAIEENSQSNRVRSRVRTRRVLSH